MKRAWLVLLACVFAVSLASASVSVNNLTFKTNYTPYETIEGEIDLSINGAEYDSVIRSSEDQEIFLGKFLEANGYNDFCSPIDCSSAYDVATTSENIFTITSGEPMYAGFYIEGYDINIDGLTFDLESDFDGSTLLPLSIKFFEDVTWNYDSFSSDFSAEKYGCYNDGLRSVGHLIGASLYCERITLRDTGEVFVGAITDLAGTGDIMMSLYSDDGGMIGECPFDPNSADGCLISDADSIVSAGSYAVCVSAGSATDYHIYEESTSPMCGFLLDSGADNSTIDYGIFAQEALYSDAAGLSAIDFGFEDLATSANYMVSLKTDTSLDCSEGCVLPMKISGVAQTLNFSNVDLDYYESSGLTDTAEIFRLDKMPASVDFEDVLDLSLTGFNVSEDGDYKLYLDGSKFLDEEVNILPAPIVKSVYPTNPPAGVPVEFTAVVGFSSNVSLTYNWDFGDGTTLETYTKKATHAYAAVGNKTITLRVSAGGNVSSERDISISVISPKDAINNTLSLKKAAVQSAIADLAKFPSDHQVPIEEIVTTLVFKDQLERLERDRDNADSDEDYIKIVQELYAMNVPSGIFYSEQATFPLLTTMDQIKPSLIETIVGGSSTGDVSGYKNPILRWQSQNVDALFSTDKVAMTNWAGEITEIFRSYTIDITARDASESYFVIDHSFDDIHVQGDVTLRNVQNSTYIVLYPDENKRFSFYYKSPAETTFFVSPRLSMMVLEEDIDTTCNFNFVCDDGEDYNTCRSDCKPFWPMIIYLILAALFVLVLYTVLQMWYKRRYENYLFEDRRSLYNLLMFISNARARGLKDKQIVKKLQEQGWSNERIVYVMKKSRGQRTGMYEIIPIEKIFAWKRDSNARKTVGVIPSTANGAGASARSTPNAAGARPGVANPAKDAFGRPIKKV